MVMIKKYENRRLYNTSESRYVNLDEVASLIRDGVEVQVVDATSGEDLTRLILVQIIAEDARAPNSAFPLDMLRQMVIASGKWTQEGVLKYMRTMFELYQNTYSAFTPSLAPLNVFQAMMTSAGRSAQNPSAAASAQEGEVQSHVRELQRRIEELERMISRVGEKAGAKTQKTPRTKVRKNKT